MLQRFRGTKQNRTAVNGFADRCLTTRPRNPIVAFASAKLKPFFEIRKFILQIDDNNPHLNTIKIYIIGENEVLMTQFSAFYISLRKLS